ncbi:MAG: hypothetical protein C0617_14875 [Desulfuromonas sp.]|uniref:Ig-like domain-containing protein n=1 Tax=Desulfuromonas sp. TaxID=892 RepID=UPI000CB61866|nr:Ig-like domain-containing protein [Desulfuromonas sp.]PLX82391.1 MAG: hypothetical protein C0617_14875 [Desulfuromonas sp.]
MKRLLAALCLIILAAIAGCSEDDDPTRPNDFAVLTSLAIGSENLFVAGGTTNQFTATGNFSGAFTRDLTAEVVWNSSDPTLLSVSNSPETAGLGQALAPGTVTVSAETEGLSTQLTFIVTDAALASLTVSPDQADVTAGLNVQFEATGTFDDGSAQELRRDVNWSSADAAVATISNATGNEGLATGVAEGSTAIIAAFAGLSAEAGLIVSAAVLDSIAITPVDPELAADTSLELTATGTFSDGSTSDLTEEVLWSSDDESIATVSNDAGDEGLARGLSAGDATIEAEFQDIIAEADLSVTDALLEEIEIEPEDPTIEVGARQQFTATGTFSDNTTQDITRDANWSSDDEDVATVSNDSDSKGLARGLDEGEAFIEASKSGISASTELTVE